MLVWIPASRIWPTPCTRRLSPWSAPTDPPEHRALGQRVIRIAPVALPCYPCAFVFATPSRCHTGTRACIESISAQQIADAALSLLDADADRKAPV